MDQVWPSLYGLPKHVPKLDDLLYDLFNPTVAELAAAMGVSERTAKRWVAENDAPLPVKLALFWLTKWGMQWTNADLYNEAQLHFSMNGCQARLIRDLKTKLHRTAKLGSFGSANDPAEGVELPLPPGLKAVQLHRQRVNLAGIAKRDRKVDPLAPGLIRERLCKPTVSYQHFVQKKRRTA